MLFSDWLIQQIAHVENKKKINKQIFGNLLCVPLKQVILKEEI
jgi:hypothetical protein